MLKLRDYQHLALEHIIRRIRDGCHRQYATLPTGTGKGLILAHVAAHRRQEGRSLVLIHRQDIAVQLVEELELAGLDVGLLMQGHRDLATPVVVAMTQSLVSGRLQELITVHEEPIATILIDEAHHAVPGSAYERIIATIEDANGQSVYTIGFTATPYRSDKNSMLSLLSTCAFARDIPDMVRAKQLTPLTWEPVKVALDLEGLEITRQSGELDYAEQDLAREMVQGKIITAIVEQVAPKLGQRPTLVFGVSVEHAEQFARAFCNQGLKAQAVSGKTRREERERIFADWRAGRVQVVCNCAVLTEGFNFPEIAALVIARPTLSPSLYLQMLGRGTRRAPGKNDCLVLDVMGNNPDLSRQVVLPHVVGDTQAEGGYGYTPTRKAANDPLLKALYGTDMPSLSLLDPIGQSQYRWTPYRLGHFEGYLARVSQHERAIIERDPDGSGLYRSRLYKKQPKQAATNTWIEHHYLPLRQQVALVHEATDARYSKALGGKEAKWLHQQATEKQLQVLQRLHPQAARQARAKVWTGQRVSDLITFLPMRETLTNPPPSPKEGGHDDVA